MVDIFAESPHVRDQVVDLLVRKEVPKRRHNLRETMRWPAMDDHCLPIAVRFRRRSGAVRKIRKRIWPSENRTRYGSTLAIVSVAGNASAVVNLLSILHIGTVRIVERLRGKQQRVTKTDDKPQDERGRRSRQKPVAGGAAAPCPAAVPRQCLCETHDAWRCSRDTIVKAKQKLREVFENRGSNKNPTQMNCVARRRKVQRIESLSAFGQ